MNVTLTQKRIHELYLMLSRLDLKQFKSGRQYDQRQYQEGIARIMELFFNPLRRCDYGHIMEPDCNEQSGHHTTDHKRNLIDLQRAIHEEEEEE